MPNRETKKFEFVNAGFGPSVYGTGLSSVVAGGAMGAWAVGTTGGGCGTGEPSGLCAEE